jgi:hypothetical protein
MRACDAKPDAKMPAGAPCEKMIPFLRKYTDSMVARQAGDVRNQGRNGLDCHAEFPSLSAGPLSFRDLLLPPLVADRSHVQQFASNLRILIVCAGMPRAIGRKPITRLCLGTDDLLPVLRSVHHWSDLLKQGDNEDLSQALASATAPIDV